MAGDMIGNGKGREISRYSRCEAGDGKPPSGGISRLPTSEGTALVEIAERVRRLVPSHRDPERFHVEKSEIEHELRRLAREVR